MTTVEIGNKKIGTDQPCFITMEAGPTHTGLASAIELLGIAKNAGADAIKFQILDPERLVADKKQLFSFNVLVNKESGETKQISEPLYDILKRRSMSKQEWKELKATADEMGIAFFATAGFEDELELLCEINCDSVKIASADLNHYPLLREAAKTGMLIQIDTGSSTLAEVEKAVDVINQAGSNNILIHQCPSGYPAHLDSIHLNMIKTLKQMFGCPVGFSDHTPGYHMDVAAVAVGADLVEKTITMDRMTPQVEHVFSLEPEDAKSFVKYIREVETGLGGFRRPMSDEQIQHRNKVRRSAFIKSGAKAGTLVSDLDIEYRRPGTGIQPDLLEVLSNLRIKSNLIEGHILAMSDLE